ncbi:lycopene cyclase domain-containing protein [Candidatus Omnitrophota bacterium]
MSDYILVLIIAGIIPFALSFWPPLKFYRQRRALVLTLGLIVLIFGSWDVLATFRGHWYFNPRAVWPLKIINLPLEEVLFFVVIPFCCIFTWEIVKYLKQRIQ